ncbi:5 -3 exoribonuclease 2 [Moniliophthora roreri MCA 2997]|uniref:5'-3' exoribonuclease n=1 Tax=Moniliophthora roreri (strain MCA 2997) TaxID=1381753 RepID=V2YPU2_MONRO|nr:5 -3 exoribonuclease 2 [Moniliophthora roreri MCA 2997]
MGVPALFRWLSKKYPKIIYPVVEDEEIKVEDENDELVTIPTNMADPNPNGTEFDCLYLDMNGIVHPCTHPEGKPAPETEEDMMVEVFKYTERVVNMVRPRKLLFMAIDGVAPRAKMNQQRSRRFRAAQEAKEKEEARLESVRLWEEMGKTISEEEKNKKAWDSNAITPGTPFMDLLAASLRYWVVQKMNSDPGWKNLQVIISDASVPGEGEHKIMDFIRRQRTNPGHDPNTKHVIYGLDADLIMLALATHEPYFRVLREDVFSDSSNMACRMCGQEGHYAAQCTATPAEVQDRAKKKVTERKPFIFLDVSILREYLEAELNVPQESFPFNLEQAIDDWVLLIFFVGNDFLPHLPSLEIREGAIDTLLRIWKTELSRMGGYLTNHGRLELARVQIILEGLAKREDDIFKRRREAEERQEQNAKRRKLEKDGTVESISAGAPSRSSSNHDFAAKADSIGLGAPATEESIKHLPSAQQALAGSNHDVVANRRAIRMANMSAAEVLKAELAGLMPVKKSATITKKPDLSLPAKPESSLPLPAASLDAIRMSVDGPPPTAVPATTTTMSTTEDADFDIPGFGGSMTSVATTSVVTSAVPSTTSTQSPTQGSMKVDDIPGAAANADVGDFNDSANVDDSIMGTKRKYEEGPGEVEGDETLEAEEEEPPADGPHDKSALEYKVNPDGTVTQEDTVKLWEPGYRERYYQQKFGVEYTDKEFRKKLTQSYIEGMSWVLCYYYQGTPSWQWYYPYHFAPFAADFEEVDKMNIHFKIGQPFKPYEQLMGVFPAASRKHIPETFHHLMTEEESPIIDFYPTTFQIDMNGKKMAWQGVALLPFIDEKRLLGSMREPYNKLTDDEIRRNTWGNNVIFAADEHPVHPFYEKLYGKGKPKDPVPLDPKLSQGISGTVLPNPDCLPGSTYFSPFTQVNLPDIRNDRSLSVQYFFPKQLSPHHSVLLPGVRRPPRILSQEDIENSRRGGRGRGRGGGGGDWGGGRGGYNNDRSRGSSGNDPFHSRPSNYPPSGYGNDRNRGYQQDNYSSRGGNHSYGGGGYGRGGGGSDGRSRPPNNQGYGGQNSGYSRGPPGGRGGGPSNNPYGSYGANGGGYGGYGGNSAGYGGYGGNTSGYGYGRGNPASYGGGAYGNGGSQQAGQVGNYGVYGGGGRGGGYNQSSRGRGRGW